MVGGADSITDLDLLRHGGMARLFTAIRAPSTLGTFLRLLTFGHVCQLDAVAAGLLCRLAARTSVLPDRDQVVFVDIDDTAVPTHPLRMARSALMWIIWLAQVSPECLVGTLQLGHLTTQPGQQFVV